jgi:hypothetical protein
MEQEMSTCLEMRPRQELTAMALCHICHSKFANFASFLA